jgi:hypothetical protein
MSMMMHSSSSNGSSDTRVSLDETAPTGQKKKRMSLLKRASISSLASFEISTPHISAPTPHTAMGDVQQAMPPMIPRRSTSRNFRPVSSYGALQGGPVVGQRPPSPPAKDYAKKNSERKVSAELISNLAGRKISGPYVDRSPLAVQLPQSPIDEPSLQSSKQYMLPTVQPLTPISPKAISLNSAMTPQHNILGPSLPAKSSSRRPLSTILPEFNYGKDYTKVSSPDDEKESVIDGIDHSIGHWISISDSPISSNTYRHRPLTLDYIDEDLPTTLMSAAPSAFTPISPTFSDQSFPSISNETLKSSASSVLTPKSSNYNLAPFLGSREDVKIYQSHGVVYFNELKLLVKDDFKPETTSALLSDENYNPFAEDEEDLPKSNFRTQWVF